MDYIDIENYENLIQIYKLNKEIYILKLEINEFEDKKNSNLYFLNIQQETYDNIIQKKINSLKKYNFSIIKNILNIYQLNKKNNELNQFEFNTTKLINDLYKSIKKYSIEEFNIKKNIQKFLIAYNDLINNLINNQIIFDKSKLKFDILTNFKYKMLKNINSINHTKGNIGINNYYLLFSYLLQYNFYNDIDYLFNNHIYIYKQWIIKYKLQIEYKEYIKYKENSIKQIDKYKSLIIKNSLIKKKNIKRLNFLYQKNKEIKNKYLYIQKDIIIFEKRNLNTENLINKNIHELNIRICIKKKHLIKCEDEINECNKNIEILNDKKGKNIIELKKEYELLNNENCNNCNSNNHICENCLNDMKETCPICLEDIENGIITICKHFLHYGCINLYIFNILQNNSKLEIICPICRQYI